MYAFGLYIAVLINGDVYEAVPAVYDTMEQCEKAQEEYTKQKDLLVESGCFRGLFKEKK